MDWIQQLLSPGNTALASTIVLYSFVIAVGVFLGKLKIGGVSLGVTFVLFVGLVMGHFGYKVNSEVLHFIREFGLILFIFSIGLQVGPGFFSSFKKGGMLLNGLAVLIILLNVVIVLGIFFIDGNTSITGLVG
ncbi:MAG: transporter, partial [Muribaculum sp.]